MYSGYCDLIWTGSCSGEQYISGIPYGNQTEADSLVYEDGFKGMRGYMTEGHFVVFESNGFALTNPGSACDADFTASPATSTHESINQRWVVYGLEPEGTAFNISSAVDGSYISEASTLASGVAGAIAYDIQYVGSSQYTLQVDGGKYLNIDEDGSISFDSEATPYKIWSVTYNDGEETAGSD
jgi:phospholipase C